jgi:hypothetical protein
MFRHVVRTLSIGATFIALVTPAALAQTGTDPEPPLIHTILHYLGLA